MVIIFYCHTFTALAVTTMVCPISTQQKTNRMKWKCCWVLTITIVYLHKSSYPAKIIRCATCNYNGQAYATWTIMHGSKQTTCVCVCVRACVRACVCVCVRASAHALVCSTFMLFRMIHHRSIPCLSTVYQTKLKNESRRIMGLGRLLSPNNWLPTYITNV